MILQNLWQVYYETLLMILQKKFTELNVKIVIVFMNTKVLKITRKIINVYLIIKLIQTSLMKSRKIGSRINLIFLIMISINLFCY